MKIIQPTNTKRIVVVASAIAILLFAAIAYAYYSKVGPFAIHSNDLINLDKPTKDELETGDRIKEQSVAPDGDKSASGSDPAPAPQPIENSDKKSVHAEITAANQDESFLRVRVLIQTVASEGVCTLAMSGPQGSTYTTTAGVQPLPSSSTCKGFDVPLDKLSPGIWTIKLDFNNDNLVASTSKELVIK